MAQNRKSRLLLSLLSGILLALPWAQWHLGWVLLVALVPLLIVDDFFFVRKTEYKSVQAFWHSYLAFFIWNLLTTWWIYFATDFGAVAAVILNAAFLAIVFWVYHIVKRRLGQKLGHIALVVFWIGFEYIYLHGKISWPWLTLGNGFANTVWMVQWYEYTGVLGGSLWVLTANLGLFLWYKDMTNGSVISWQRKAMPVALFVFPVLWSLYLYSQAKQYVKNGRAVEVVVVQPNIDPYGDKFGGMSPQQQIERFLSLADSLVDSNTVFLVGPETAIPMSICENSLDDYREIQQLRDFVKPYPKLNIVIGASTYRLFDANEKTPTAHQIKGSNQYYDSYNTALSISVDDSIQIYHKSKLVIGVEEIPYENYFKPLQKLAINLGGSMISLGTQKERSVFTAYDDTVKIAPVICYESIYGDFVTEYIRKEAHLLAVLTNDGWWHDTPGYKQHFTYSQLRSIETRRYLVRSANTGISGVIDPMGKILQKTQWWKKTAFKATVYLNTKKTFYVRFGDYIGRLSIWITLLLFGLFFLKRYIFPNSQF